MRANLPLYLKYRPRKLSELVGQELVVRILSNSIARNKLSHAYLLTGPRGCGKTSTARIIAKSLNCQEEMSAEPCGKCINCLEISKSISPDVIEMDAASNRGVEDASRLIEKSYLAPQKSRFKIYILDEVHMLSNTAFNALLKTIEEPPKNVIFVLATTEEHKVPQTIISRCQNFSFRPIDLKSLKVHLKKISELEQIKVSEKALEQIAKQSKGGLRDALGLLDQVSILGLGTDSSQAETIEDQAIFDLLGLVSEDTLKEFLDLLQAQKAPQALLFLDRLLEEGVNPLQFLRNFLEFSIEVLEQAVSENQQATRIKLTQIISKLFDLENSLRTTSNSTLKLKSAIVSICDQQVKLPTPAKTIERKPEPEKKEIKQTEVTPQIQISNSEDLIEVLLERTTSIPVKSLIKAAKLSCSEDSREKVVFQVAQKVFYDKLKEKSRFEKIHETLKEIKQNPELIFEINKGTSTTSSPAPEKKKPEIVVPKEIKEEIKSTVDKTEEIWAKAEYILGARRIKE